MNNPIALLLRRGGVVALLFFAGNYSGQAQPSIAWAARMGGSSSDSATGVTVDRNGNTIVVGYFYPPGDFGQTNLSAANSGYPDTFISKYGTAGNLLWARQSGFYYSDTARAVAVDSNGNAFVVGNFSNFGTFVSTNLSSFNGSDDIFIAKYDSDGTFLWILQIGGGSSDYAYGVAVDPAGNFYVGGFFYGPVDFGGVTTTATSGADGYIAKYNNDGRLIWVRTVSGNAGENVTSIAVDQAGNPYIAGNFPNTVMIGTTCFFSSGGNDIFIAKLDTNGNFLWARQAGGNSDDGVSSVAVDRSGNCFVTGYFSGTSSFGDTNLYSPSYEAFLAKYSSNGTLQWARRAGSVNYNDWGRAVAADTNGNAFLTGQFFNTIDFGSTNLTPFQNEDIFVARYDPKGNVGWAVSAGGGNNTESGYGIAVDDVGNCVVAGQFTGSGTFGGTNLYAYGGSSDGFVMKLQRDLPVIVLQPTNTIAMERATAIFLAGANGTGPLTYQWQFNGNAISGATNAVLQRSNITTNDSGSYRLLVSNYEGTVATVPVTLTVLTLSEAVNAEALTWTSGGDLPWFNQTNVTHDGITAARSGAITNGQQSWIETAVVGPARVNFFWKVSSENGYDVLAFLINDVVQTNISGKIDWKELSFLLPPGTQRLRWSYAKDESESVGQDSGWIDQVRVVYTPALANQPQGVTTVVGSNITLFATTTGTLPISFQWFRDGISIPGATSEVLAINNIQADRAGGYRLVASNSAGSATSDVAIVTVHIPPQITQQPASATVSPGEALTLNVAATSQSALIYQWRLNGVNISGETNAALVLGHPGSRDVGMYDVVISSATGTTISAPARLTLLDIVVLPVVVVEGSLGSNYRIEYKASVDDTSWSLLDNVTVSTSPLYYLDVAGRGQPRRFYRVVPLP